jgi:hypothetical protein
MNKLEFYDLNNYNFYENNKLFTLEFNLDDLIIYELIGAGYIKKNILKKIINVNNINLNIKKKIVNYISNSHKLLENEINFIYKYIKSNNEYVKNLSLWVDLDKLKKQVKAEIVRDFELYLGKNRIKNINILEYSNNDIIKIYLFFSQNFVGLMIIIIIKKLGFNFLEIKTTPKSSRIITINENIVTLNLQEYVIESKNNKFLLFYYKFKIIFLENKFILEYKCKWDDTFNIKFFKCAELYSEKVNKIENKKINRDKSYSYNLTLLLNNKLNNKLRDELYSIIKSIVDKIDNQSDLDNLNKILKDINDYIDEDYDFNSIIYNLLDNKDINNFLKNKNLINKIYKTIPIKKDETKQSYEKDFLLINFNEEKKSFDDNDCMSMFIKILIEQPSFIIISTQDCKTGGKEHYQHLLGERLKDNGYNILVKNTINTLRMRIYYNTKKVKFNKSEQKHRSMQGGDLIPSRIKQIFKKSNNLHVKENFSNSSNNSKNLEKDIFLVKNYGRKESNDKKYGHGLVFMRLEITKNNSFTKFIFINCDLSLNREYELENIVNDFKLVYYWEKGYNIFFCGTFNFTFKPFLYENTEIIKPNYYYNESNNEKNNLKEKKGQIAYNAGPKKFISEYSTNNSINKRKSSEKFIKSDNLAIFLEKIIKNGTFSNKNTFKTTFYLNLLDSIEKLGIHPTYKYIKNESDKQLHFYNNIIDYTNKLKDINIQNRYIIKFLNIPNLLEKIKDFKNLVYEYFSIFVKLNLFDEVRSIIENTKSKNIKEAGIIINEESKNIKKEKIINYLMNMKEKNFINKKTVNELLIQKYNKNGKIKSIINFLEGINEQNKNKIKKYIDNLQKFINDKESFNKVKIIIEKYIENKDIFKLNKECEKFIKNIIDKGLITEDENNNIVIEKKRDNLLEKYNEIFNTEGNKIIPYQNNRILYALGNMIKSRGNIFINTNSFDFEVYLFPDKSSHKLTTLSFKIYEEGNIIIKKNRTLISEEENNYKNNLEQIDPIVGKNISNTHVIPSKIVSSIIKKIEENKTKTTN